jgi:membrane dipeptidase
MERLLEFYDLGVRLITLTWNHANCIGAPASADPALMGRGLTDFGRELIGQMNALGMAVDVSHLSDGGVQEVLELSKKPVVASHSCSRSCNPHPRNLPDALLRAVANGGGVVGLNFSPTFLPEQPMTGGRSRVEDMVRHTLHMLDVGGEDAVALGTDFDGLMGSCDIASPLEMERLFWQMEKAGITQRVVEKIAWKNAYRALMDIL